MPTNPVILVLGCGHLLVGSFKAMSRTCGITVSLETRQHNRLDLLCLLMNYGWHFDGRYLPVGDDGMYDWQAVSPTEWPSVRTILNTKEAQNEQLALGLHWHEQLIGGTFHIEPSTEGQRIYRLWTIWSAQRPRLIDEYWFTDHGWYLQRIVPAFEPSDVSIVSIECSDVY